MAFLRAAAEVNDPHKERGSGGAEHGFDFPATLTAETASGGRHFYYQAPASHALGNTTAGLPGVEQKLPGIDFRGDGGYVRGSPLLGAVTEANTGSRTSRSQPRARTG